ncbi:MAG TPA: hypothetical protein DCS93_01660 [Microscillaceae bacterium]|nr:hypothetical protein [Microscillaceae bacterium]
MGAYDHILKANIHEIFPDLCRIQLGIAYAKGEDIKDKLQATVEREADFLQKVTTANGEQLIVHLEFQATDDATMIDRMHFYWMLLQQKYKMEIRQYVLYIGNGTPKMTTILPPEKQYKGFQLLNLGVLDYQPLLNSNNPEEVVWAVLYKMDPSEVPIALEAIIARLYKLTTPKATFYKYLRQVMSFGRLRNFSHIIQEILENMDIVYNVKEDAFYQQGEAKGEAKGRLAEKKAQALKMKQKNYPIEEIVDITGLTREQIEQL